MYDVPKKKPGQVGIEKLLRAFDENPIAVIATAAMALTAVAKVVDSLSGIQSRRAYAKRRK